MDANHPFAGVREKVADSAANAPKYMIHNSKE
jgi:hypothetical protein